MSEFGDSALIAEKAWLRRWMYILFTASVPALVPLTQIMTFACSLAMAAGSDLWKAWQLALRPSM